MEIKGKVEIQGFTRIYDLEDGAVFVFYDENEPMLKGYSDEGIKCYAIRLADGAVFDALDKDWEDRPVRQIKAVLTV